jgi:glyoxylase-like metal-dependent hydrolase (beta-lactamase superfamily II)
MKELADGVFLLPGLPAYAINAYLAEDVLIDAATRHSARRLLRQLRGRTVTAHALTHAHPDHQGASHAVCEKLGIPLWCGAADVGAAEDPARMKQAMPDTLPARFFFGLFHGPGHAVQRPLREGDPVGGFMVLDVPGHSPGHVAFWRESDRVLICGDVLANMDQLTALPGLHQPSRLLTADPARNRESARRLAALEPALVCFGHGRPLRNPRKLADFVARLS